MPTVRVPLPLTLGGWRNAIEAFDREFEPEHRELYFAVEEGELIVSTESLGDDPSVAPLTEGAYTP